MVVNDFGQGFEAIRARFPALQAHGAPVYIDNPGGTQVPRDCIDAVAAYLSSSNSNTGGAFATSLQTDDLIQHAREGMADFLGGLPREIGFGASMTSLNYVLTRALGRDLRPGDEIICTTLDHDANISPWLALEEQSGAVVKTLDVSAPDWTLDLGQLARLVGPRTRVIAHTLASNALGTLTPARQIAELAHSVGALSWVDAVHFGPHAPIDVERLGCDILLCSAYKFFGPHLGIFWGRSEVLERLRPFKLRPASDEVPFRFEYGTLNHEGLAGLLGTLQYLESIGAEVESRVAAEVGAYQGRARRLKAALTAFRAYERGLSERLLVGLAEIPGLRLHGIADPARAEERVPTFAFTLDGVHPRSACEQLAARGFNAWDGDYYALAIMDRLGLEPTGGAIRIGLVHYNTGDEAERFLEALREVR
jgi:cysteine desulfurase family protein (TIGR01976 family)